MSRLPAEERTPAGDYREAEARMRRFRESLKGTANEIKQIRRAA